MSIVEGATPKDGQVLVVLLLLPYYHYYLIEEVRNDFAMTGEIDLQGNILEIGGLESKIIGATKHGIFNVICQE